MTISIGDRGQDVITLQKYLDLYPDGIFGKTTQEAVKTYQRDHNLKSDGIVGPSTWNSILENKNATLHKSRRVINEVILHCTATPEGVDKTVEEIKRDHIKNRGWSDIGYHYVIYRDGTIHAGRNIDIIGSHCAGHNSKSIGVVYVGGVTSKLKPKDTRTPAQVSSLLRLVHKLMDMYKLTPAQIKGHCEYANKACPSFDMNQFRKDLLK